MKEKTVRKAGLGRLSRVALAASAVTLLATTFVVASTVDPEPSLSQIVIPDASDFSDGTFTCTAGHLTAILERQQRIADAATVEEARDLALTPARAARRALQVAGLVSPSGGRISEAKERLEGFEGRVEASDTPAAVAGEFGRLLDIDMRGGGLMQVADLNVQNASVRGPGGCHYSTGEIVAIVIGFILFIIPGIILLFVLC